MNYYELISKVPESQKQELNLDMFKAYDIRTKSPKLSHSLSRRLLLAIARYIKECLGADYVILGRDARLAAPGLMELAVEVMSAFDLNVLLNPLQESTCLFYFSCLMNPHSAGIMFTASHNPGEFIGLKIMAPGMQTLALDSGPAGGLTAILAFYLEGKEPPVSYIEHGEVRSHSYLDQYIDYSIRLAGMTNNSLSGIPILVDFLSGTAGIEITESLQFAGAKVRVRNLVPDGYFPNGDPNPGVPSSVKPTLDMIRQGNFSFGFCYDGDGDRIDVISPRGEQLAPSFNLSVLLPEILELFKKAHKAGAFKGGTHTPWNPQIYADVKSIPIAMIDQAARGVGVHIIRNGHSFIKEALRTNFKNQYLAASEESAHYYMNFPYDLDDFRAGFAAMENTLYFTLLTSRIWAEHPAWYEQAMTRQKQVFRQREWPCHFKDERLLEKVMTEVEAEFRNRGLSIIITMEDGSTLDATLMRKGLPEIITANTSLARQWYQVAQRITRSEEGIARWDVVASTEQDCRKAVAAIRAITDRYVATGLAEYV